MDDDYRDAYWGGYEDGERNAVYYTDDGERNAAGLELRNKRRRKAPMVTWQQQPPQPWQPQQPVVVAAPPPPPAPPQKAGVFANLPKGALIATGAQLLSALMPLPPAPSATGDTKADLDNVLRYQSNLADHAKRDQQIRAIGAAVGLLV